MREQKDPPTKLDRIACSNTVCLSVRQWLGLGLFDVAIAVVAPVAWKQVEEFTLEPDYRMPRELNDDYWFYERYVTVAAEKVDALVLGDSVVWGEFVTRSDTLSHYLNRAAGKE